jgi:hypothetical protein
MTGINIWKQIFISEMDMPSVPGDFSRPKILEGFLSTEA